MTKDTSAPYRLDDQIGFIMRRANQRHLAIFAKHIPDLTPTQFAALARLCEVGETSQNALGRATAMDAATIKGVVDRLRDKGFVSTSPSPDDLRRVNVKVTPQGWELFDRIEPLARQITAETLEPLNDAERTIFQLLLNKLV
ncbi:DNA-binding MarR family transcriptional regulator [Shimia isoporae]|uniref:DNA-binding MarR family transcriptional regulator n=1 Tax=Shimia isoporae TaxID=647720 RepID=A0A4R1NW17_9RHOB|nr:MarR family winged helix-turn-helix transcriptional regulator [Shimia isoporae]TCL09488.1 DNA-binding MarR family transcriptional regulator [Shimia isoporae]